MYFNTGLGYCCLSRDAGEINGGNFVWFFVKEVKNGEVFFVYTFRGYDIYLEMVKMDESFFFVSLYTIIILRFSSS